MCEVHCLEYTEVTAPGCCRIYTGIDYHACRMLLPDETYEQNALVAGHLLAMLRMYDDFLSHYRIRPEFFCRYREKQALQKRLSRVLAETKPRRVGSKRKDQAEPLKEPAARAGEMLGCSSGLRRP